MGSVTSHTFTFIPATTRSSTSQKAMNSRLAGSPRNDHAIPGASVARVLHADVVLVGEEVRQAVVRVSAPEHVARRRRSLVEGVRPVLDPNSLAVERVIGVRHVAGREDRRSAGLGADRRPRSRCRRLSPAFAAASSVRGSTPTPTTTKSHSSTRPSLVRTRSTAVAALERLDPDAHAAASCHGRCGCRGTRCRPRRPARARAGRPGGSSTVTSSPRCRAEAATSAPIHPAPTTTTVPPRSSRSRSASESSTLRR